MKADAQSRKVTMSATIIRKDGRREVLGVIQGGAWWQRALAFCRIKLANWRQKWQQS